ncbi:MAG: UDP-N-acetylmuramoyl-tripeptide--D-alanyl-D-alanine ligase [Planctomycetota bacterium]|nr:UDP-N-acetylmuramoyl-tripeptide--D-alanyl-D-alanine ligase [Planctomycetota bacterium]
MFIHTLEAIAQATQGTILRGSPDVQIRGVYTDTRATLPGGLFVAIVGANFDGNRFAFKALEDGAAAVLVSDAQPLALEQRPESRGVIRVDDTREAYLRLAELHRRSFDETVWCAVTGSAGKSTTKDMLAAILETGARLKIHRALKSFNNEIGVPATVLGVGPEHQAAVLEMGMNHPGEIVRLARAARPQVAAITNAGPVHLEALGSVEGVAEEKSHILDFMGPRGVAVLNADDPFFDYWARRAPGRVVSFGTSEQADVRGVEIEQRPGSGAHFFLCAGDEAAEVQLKVPGRHNVLNALAAAAAAWSTGVVAGRSVNLRHIVAGLCQYMGTGRRFQTILVDGVTVIDDAYNASPLSFRAALDALKDFAGRRWFVIAADMLELGSQAEAFHVELGRAFAHAAPQLLLTVGPLAQVAGSTAVRHGLPAHAWSACGSPEEAAERLRPQLQPGDVVLVKGSNGMHLNRCVARLTERVAAAAAGE